MIVAYWLACIAASLVLTIGTLTPVWDDFKPFDLQWSCFGRSSASAPCSSAQSPCCRRCS
jgi:hypothetical protein